MLIIYSNPDLLVVFLDARSTVNLENSLRQLIHSRDAKFWDKDHKDAILWLSTTKTAWPVILDNADDPEMDLSPYLPMGKGNHIVITSRNPVRRVLAPNSNHEVGKLDLDNSIKLLLSTSQYPDTETNRAYAKDIVGALHHHSLAIVQAGGYIIHNQNLSQYLSILKQRRDQILSDDQVEEPSYHLTVYASLQLSFDQIPPVTRDVLWVLSFLNSTQVDEEILVRAATVQFIQYSDAIDIIPSLREKLEYAAGVLKPLFCPVGE